MLPTGHFTVSSARDRTLVTIVMFALGDRNIYLSVTYFEDEPRVHIRKHARKKVTGNLDPQKKEIALKVGQWAKLKEFIQNVDSEVARLQQPQPPPYTSMPDLLQTALDYSGSGNLSGNMNL